MVKSIPVVLIFVFAHCNNPEDDMIITRENAKKGELLFNSVGCTLCHSVSGESRYKGSAMAPKAATIGRYVHTLELKCLKWVYLMFIFSMNCEP